MYCSKYVYPLALKRLRGGSSWDKTLYLGLKLRRTNYVNLPEIQNKINTFTPAER